MATRTSEIPLDTLIVLPWLDPVVDAAGYDPRSPYVECFWLGILGPSTTWLLRRFATGFDTYPDGFELDLVETAAALGLANGGGRHGPFARSLQRCVQFGMAQPHSRGLLVRRRLPPVSHRQLARLPAHLHEAHRAWTAPDDEAGARRARLLARSFLDSGDDPTAAERSLQLVGVPPRRAADAVRDATCATAQVARAG